MRPTSVRCWGPLLLLCCGSSLAVGQKPRVGVRFQIVAELYSDRYAPAQVRQVSDSAAAVLARGLAQRLGFLAFTSDTTYPTAAKLTGRLEESARRRDRFDEVRLFLELVTPGRAPRTLNWLGVRPRESMDPVSRDPDVFVAGFGQLLDDSLTDAALTRLVDSLLSQIPIADTSASVWRPAADRPPEQWLLPYTRAELCIGFESNLRIDYTVKRAAGTQQGKLTAEPSIDFSPPSSAPPEFQRFVGAIGATPVPGDTLALSRIQADIVQVKAVFVVKYHFDEDTCRLLQGPTP